MNRAGYAAAYQRSLADPEGFWGAAAEYIRPPGDWPAPVVSLSWDHL